MAGKRGYILVEGHGEVEAAHNLIVRLSQENDLHAPWAKPRRWLNLHLWKAGRGGVLDGAELFRARADAGALLILRDEDDACPKDLAPKMGQRLAALRLPFPVAYVLLHPEYEVLFLPCLSRMGFPAWDRDSWEARRGIKEWLSAQRPRGRTYKPTVDQLPLTRQIDFAVLRGANVPSFGSLERAVQFLKSHWGQAGAVYPSSA